MLLDASGVETSIIGLRGVAFVPWSNAVVRI